MTEKKIFPPPLLHSKLGPAGSVVCGGSVISHNKVLTAAHCNIKELNDNFAIRVGGETNTDGMRFPITNTYRHENFSRGPHGNPIDDLMIVEFYNPDQKLGMWAPRLNPNTSYPAEEVMLTTSGYGRLGVNQSLPGHLRSVNVPVVPLNRCKITYPEVLKQNNICAGNEMFDSCKGDSGGPLWTRAKNNSTEIVLVGIVSYGFGCAFPNAPGVYSRISGYTKWINKIISLPPTVYVAPKFSLWRVVLIVGAPIVVSVVIVVICIVCMFSLSERKQSSSSRVEG